VQVDVGTGSAGAFPAHHDRRSMTRGSAT
jgi:hypothetical protein